jgi:hypothetical protein
MKTVRFYHSMICPRCHLSALFLRRITDEFPDVAVERLEYFANLGQARQDGVRGFPTLVAGERRLAGVFLTPKSIRRFLEAL